MNRVVMPIIAEARLELWLTAEAVVFLTDIGCRSYASGNFIVKLIPLNFVAMPVSEELQGPWRVLQLHHLRWCPGLQGYVARGEALRLPCLRPSIP